VSAPQAPTFEELTAVRRPGSAPASRTPEATGSPNAPQVDVVADGSFEAGTPNPSWNEFSLLFGTPLCTVALCGGPAPHTGIWHAWFGGAGGPAEEGYVDQDVTILSGTATLSFWLQIGVVSPATGVLTASVDGTAVFTATEADAATYSTYTQVTVDVSAFADDGVHNLRLGQSNPDNGANNINFFVDDVVLDAVTAGGCTANDIPWLSVSPSFGTTPFGNTSEVEVTFDSTGLASGTYTGTVCIDSNDPVNPTINVPVTLTVTPPSVALAASSYSVAENAGSTTVTATLSASYPTTVTVSYATSDGTALAGSDYTTVTGTLTFAPGATSATFTVPILDDTADEPDVLFTVTLSSPSGATLGSPASATVTILDDEVVYLLHLPIILRGTVN
jgi:hypothetical protein